MNIPKSRFVGLVVCAVFAAVSVLVNETLSYLGSTYWFLLWSLALIHLGVSAVVLFASPRKILIGLAVLALLIIGQWRAIQMIAMLTIWSVRRFAP